MFTLDADIVKDVIDEPWALISTICDEAEELVTLACLRLKLTPVMLPVIRTRAWR
jgi:hypothetical protein